MNNRWYIHKSKQVVHEYPSSCLDHKHDTIHTMSFIDPSNFEAIELLIRPFREDLEDPWSTIRALCVGCLVISVVIMVFSLNASSDNFAKAKSILNITGLVTFVLFIISYLSIYLKLRRIDQDRENAKIKRVTDFR